jgi:hypothetical protein
MQPRLRPFLLLSCFVLTALSWAQGGEGTFETVEADVESFVYKALHEKARDARERLRCYKTTEDDDADSDEVLSVTMNRVLIQKADFTILELPTLEKPPVGTYRVTARIKMQGMPHSLGNAVAIRAGDQDVSFYPYDFEGEDVFKELSLDVEYPRPRFLDMPDDEIVALAKAEIHKFAERDEAELAKFLSILDRTQPFPRKARLNGRVQNWLVKGLTYQPFIASLVFPKNVARQSGGLRKTRGVTTPHTTLRRVIVDWVRLEKLPEPDHITLRYVEPQYAWRKPGERQTFHIHMHNRSGKSQTGTLRVKVKNGLTNVVAVGEKAVTLKDGKVSKATMDWAIPKDVHPWGQEVEVELVKGGAAKSAVRSWFTIHQRNTAVMIPIVGSPHAPAYRGGVLKEGVRWTHPYAPKPVVNNYHEYWAATPYDSAGVIPDDITKPYLAGNSADMRSFEEMKWIVDDNKSHGIATAFYLEGHGTANRAYELYLKDPEKVYGKGTTTDEYYQMRLANEENLKKLAASGKPFKLNEKQLGPFSYTGNMVMFNGLFPENVERVLKGALIFSPVRSDGPAFAGTQASPSRLLTGVCSARPSARLGRKFARSPTTTSSTSKTPCEPSSRTSNSA